MIEWARENPWMTFFLMMCVFQLINVALCRRGACED